VLAVIAAFNNADGMALGLVLQSVKATYRVSDTQLGLMTGIAFSLFYSVLGVPIGRWADRGNRVAIIAASVAVRSAMVMLMGSARSFGQLLLIRVGVAAGEAGFFPPALSLLADGFNQAERPQAVGKVFAGGALSAVIGYFVGGWLNRRYGWQTMFLLLGMSGPILIGLVLLTLHEPRSAGGRNAYEGGAKPEASCPPVAEVARVLWRNKTLRHLVTAICISSFFGAGTVQWQPAFFIRSHGADTVKLSVWFSLMFGPGAAAAMYCGGILASRFAPRNERLQLKVMAALNGAFGLISAGAYLSSNQGTALTFVGIATVGVLLQGGPLYAVIQTIVPETMLATTVSIVFLISNLVGTGLGPLAVGSLSDAMRPWLGNESLRFALLATCPGFMWCAWHLARAALTVRGDTAAARGDIDCHATCMHAPL